jgi:hypothetical protein
MSNAQRASEGVMKYREIEMNRLINNGFTVREAGRMMGLTKHQWEHLAKTRGIKCLHGALSEAKSDAAIKGNKIRWGS